MAGQMLLDDVIVPEMVTMPGLRKGRYLTLQERYEEWRPTPEGGAGDQ